MNVFPIGSVIAQGLQGGNRVMECIEKDGYKTWVPLDRYDPRWWRAAMLGASLPERDFDQWVVAYLPIQENYCMIGQI